MSERGRRIPDVVAAAEPGPGVRLPGFLERDAADPFRGRVTGHPVRDVVPILVDDAAIVEFYAPAGARVVRAPSRAGRPPFGELTPEDDEKTFRLRLHRAGQYRGR